MQKSYNLANIGLVLGTAALIMRMLKMPDGRIKILVQGVSRARIVSGSEWKQTNTTYRFVSS